MPLPPPSVYGHSNTSLGGVGGVHSWSSSAGTCHTGGRRWPLTANKRRLTAGGGPTTARGRRSPTRVNRDRWRWSRVRARPPHLLRGARGASGGDRTRDLAGCGRGLGPLSCGRRPGTAKRYASTAHSEPPATADAHSATTRGQPPTAKPHVQPFALKACPSNPWFAGLPAQTHPLPGW